MSFNPRPCPHCAGTSFHVIPSLQFDVFVSGAIFGRGEAVKIKAQLPRWTVTLVACAQCGRTETFSNGIEQLAAMFPTSQTVTSTRAN